MAGLDDLSRGELADILRRLRALETAAPLQNSSIGSNGLRVWGGGGIVIENGGLSVTGTATITGTLQADGTIAFTGTLTQSGPSTFTGDTTFDGPTHINGATDITGATTITGTTTITGNTDVTGDLDVDGPMTTTGTLSVEGVTTLKNDLIVAGGGEIVAGNTKISPSASNGGIEFISGGGVGGNGGAVVLKGTGNAGLISNASMTSMFAGAGSLDVDSSGATVNGTLKVVGMTSTSSAANVYYDTSTKQLYYKP